MSTLESNLPMLSNIENLSIYISPKPLLEIHSRGILAAYTMRFVLGYSLENFLYFGTYKIHTVIQLQVGLGITIY